MTVSLNEYNEKRNFDKTLEPQGMAEAADESLRFVVQHHMARREHYDFRLEWNQVLLSWAVPKGPSFDTHDKRLAVQVEDHPLEYRNFEGTIPKGEYGGGVVLLWDEGYWEPQGNVEDGLREGVLKFILTGKRLKGKWALIRLKAKEGDTKNNWLLLKEKDEYVNTAGISEFTTSIRTGRTIKEIEAGEAEKFIKNPFNKVEVQLAKLAHTIPEEEDWLYELKYDGYRIVAFVEGNQVRLITRNGNDYTRRFQAVASSLIDLAAGRAMVLDGEVAITDSAGKTDFQALQHYMKNPKPQNLTYIVFDLLALDGVDLRGYPLTDRKEKLEILLKDAPKRLFYSRYIRGMGKESFAAADEAGMEGIVGKRADSVYSGTRNGDWIKLKCEKRQEFVIGGYTLSDKKARGISSLLLGVYEGKDLIYAGRAGTGFNESDIKHLLETFENIIRRESAFKEEPGSKQSEEIIWLEPELVAEIKFAEWTKDNLLRQASFQGLRTDKDPREVRREMTEQEIMLQSSGNDAGEIVNVNTDSILVGGIKITSPGKVIYEEPEIKKADIVRYYEKVSERMLPYLSHRILSVVRCPKGISQTSFFKKHPGADSKAVITIPVTNGSGETEEYFYLEDLAGILYEAQMCTLEFHTWGSRVNEIEKPDMMVFDLDPDEGMDLSRVRQGVRDIRSILSELSLNSYLKTSGGKGYHVVVPLTPIVTWEVFHDFARSVAKVMEQKWPDRYTSNIRKSKRTDRIFIDWIRNGRGATSVAPYSLRARKGAKVSMPITWEELDTVAPDGVNMAEALLRISASDPWKDFYNNNQSLRQNI
jgi:bifunctional non-homologous end joining protein LigD